MRFADPAATGQIKSAYVNDAMNSLIGAEKEDEQAEATMRLYENMNKLLGKDPVKSMS